MSMLRTRVRIVFRDRDGGEGAMSFTLSPSLSTSEIVSFLNTANPILSSLTNASIVSATAYQRYEFDAPNVATADADTNRKLALFYRNEEYTEGLYVPSPKEDLFASSGPYAGVRLDLPSSAVDAFNAALVAFPGPLATEEGEPFPMTFWIGGKML